jgi:Caspase domain
MKNVVGRFGIAVLFGGLAVGLCRPVAAAPRGMRRIAVLVGANAPPPGRQALRFAHDDANELAGVLEQVGGFAPSDVKVLLDPRPPELLKALDAAAETASDAGGDVLFVFYYSGHSDGAALFPHGEPIPLADLRGRIEHLSARIRVGILDTCRGGAWTQSKGLSVGPPLTPADLMNVDTEGTALMSSSSGFENAHEADAVHGSFFTHYLAAGLRGAADRAGDGNITLQEAYDYARERTVTDSARLAKTPQHPSFDIALHGRQDIVLSVLAVNTSAMTVSPQRAPIEIIQLPSGVTLADAPAGQGPVRIALPPGRYLVRSVVDGHVYSKELEVRAGETVSLADGQLEATGNERLALKGDAEAAAPAHEDRSSGPWLSRPLTLHSLAFSADVALGVGQTTAIDAGPTYDTPVGTKKPGAGLNIEATLGLPARFEFGVRFGVRFGPNGALTNSDAYGRLFDPVSLHTDAGTYSFANPEFRIREALVDGEAAGVGFEARLTPGFADASNNIVTLGVPVRVRVRVPFGLRIDTGVYVPITFENTNTWGLEIPVALWFQYEHFFVGPLSGVFWNNPATGPEATEGVPSELDIHAGVGGGFTFGRYFDVKAQLLTTRLNHSDFTSYIGGGAGIGVVLP